MHYAQLWRPNQDATKVHHLPFAYSVHAKYLSHHHTTKHSIHTQLMCYTIVKPPTRESLGVLYQILLWLAAQHIPSSVTLCPRNLVTWDRATQSLEFLIKSIRYARDPLIYLDLRIHNYTRTMSLYIIHESKCKPLI